MYVSMSSVQLQHVVLGQRMLDGVHSAVQNVGEGSAWRARA